MNHFYVGSGDIAAIVGYYRPELAPVLCKWKSAGDVWLRLVHGIDLPHKPTMGRGLREENPLRQVYRENVGEVSELPGLIHHPRFEWAGGSPDGLGLDRVVELKTHSIYAAAQWGETSFENPTDLVPDKYNLQCQWLMGLCELSLADLLMGFGRDMKDENGEPMFAWSETRLYRIHFNAELFADCERFAEKFYLSHVLTKVAPSVKPVENRRAFKRLTDGTAKRSEADPEVGRGVVEGPSEDSASHEGQL